MFYLGLIKGIGEDVLYRGNVKLAPILEGIIREMITRYPAVTQSQ